MQKIIVPINRDSYLGPLVEVIGLEPLDATPSSHLRLVGVGQDERLQTNPLNHLITLSAALELLAELKRILRA